MFKTITTRLLTLALITMTACSRQPHQWTPEQMDAAWKKVSTTTKEHAVLKQLAGTWKGESSWIMAPGQKAEVSKSTSVNTLLYGGKFLKQEYRGKMMDKKFSGSGIIGYDTVKEKFNSTWIDSMSTAIMIGKGTYDAGQHTITFNSKVNCPFSKHGMYMRSVVRIVSPNEHTFEMYAPGVDGEEFLTLQIKYKKVQ
jgi:hypothetical protein